MIIVLEKQEKYYNEIIADLEKYAEASDNKNVLNEFIKRVLKFARFNKDLKKTFKSVESCNYARENYSVSKVITLSDNRKIVVQNLLNHCGSVSVCPTCSMKIARKRIDDLITIYQHHAWRSVGMMTLTCKHKITDNAEDIIKKMNKAFSDFVKNNSRKSFKDIHFVKNWEVNYGKNGWHYHFHVALFSDEVIKAFELKKLWIHMLKKNGLIENEADENVKRFAFNYESFNYTNDNKENKKNSERFAKYMNKLAFELAHVSTKKAKKAGSYSFFDICKLMTKSKENFDYFYHIFIEYCEATKGIRCRYSKNLKKMCNIVSDEDIANNENEDKEKSVNTICAISKYSLKYLKQNLLFDKYKEVVLTTESVEAINDFLDLYNLEHVLNADEAKDFEAKVKAGYFKELAEQEKARQDFINNENLRYKIEQNRQEYLKKISSIEFEAMQAFA